MSSGSYDYDLKVVKPGQMGLADFGVGQGRAGQGQKGQGQGQCQGQKGRGGSMKTESCYGYQHYEYDSYVWHNKSSVFPNTKCHLVDFGKQTDRYTAAGRSVM